MTRRLNQYVNYTIRELNSYTQTEGSGVKKINTNLHLTLSPYGLADFKHALQAHITRKKVGYYDKNLDGIVLDIKNIKILGSQAALRADDPHIHVNINANCYVFCPQPSAILSGVVKHIGSRQLGVIIYRVFNVNIRLADRTGLEHIHMDQEVKFRIKDFNLKNVFPFIVGELVSVHMNGVMKKPKSLKFETTVQDEAVDSGVEVKEIESVSEVLALIKKEQSSDSESKSQHSSAQKTKRKRKSIKEEPTHSPPINTKIELSESFTEIKSENDTSGSLSIKKKKKKTLNNTTNT